MPNAKISALTSKATPVSGDTTVIVDSVGGLNKKITLGTLPISTATQSALDLKQNTLTNPVTGTGTSGQVSFWNGTSTQGGSNNLFWDNSNNRLGINTNSPSESIHVIGSAIRGQNSTIDGIAKDFAMVLGHNTNAEEPVSLFTTISNAGQSIIYIGGGLAAYNAVTDLRFFTAASNTTTIGTERMRITSDGNVGFGTTSISARVHISTVAAANRGLLVRGVASQTANLQEWQNSSGSALASVSATGRIGINTSSPVGSLDIRGTSGTQTEGDLVVDTTNSIIYIGKLDSAFGNTNLVFRDRIGQVKSRWENAASGSVGFGNFGNGFGIRVTHAQISGSIGSIGSLFLVQGAAIDSNPLSVVRGHTTQNGNLTEWQNSGASVLFSIKPDGKINVATANSATTVGATGAASALPALPLGYIIAQVNGTDVKIPYYTA